LIVFIDFDFSEDPMGLVFERSSENGFETIVSF
jgi:hypothetical protein